jgi:hypothetical protein
MIQIEVEAAAEDIGAQPRRVLEPLARCCCRGSSIRNARGAGDVRRCSRSGLYACRYMDFGCVRQGGANSATDAGPSRRELALAECSTGRYHGHTDPEDGAGRRYWDGARWTGSRVPTRRLNWPPDHWLASRWVWLTAIAAAVVVGIATIGSWNGNIVSATQQAVEETGLPLCEDVLSGEAPLPESNECVDEEP